MTNDKIRLLGPSCGVLTSTLVLSQATPIQSACLFALNLYEKTAIIAL